MFVSEIDEADIEAQLDEATMVVSGEADQHYPSMTYGDGVSAALRWVLGHVEEAPFEEA